MDTEQNQTETRSHSVVPFAFGKNWGQFQKSLSEERIQEAEESLQRLLKRTDLKGHTFLDAGSGSGLFSLAAYRLGADVTSFDVDSDSAACTQQLKHRYAGEHHNSWRILDGSLLDDSFMNALGEFDIVYCWGVAHHTGRMWLAIDNLTSRLKTDGIFVLAIYNDQLYVSRAWRGIKRIYNRLPAISRSLYVVAIGSALFMKRFFVTSLACFLRLLTLQNPLVPFLNWARESQSRGMHGWYDLVDWVGGWPFEVARPEEIFRFVRDRGFRLEELSTSVGHGCNEFVFARVSSSQVPLLPRN